MTDGLMYSGYPPEGLEGSLRLLSACIGFPRRLSRGESADAIHCIVSAVQVGMLRKRVCLARYCPRL